MSLRRGLRALGWLLAGDAVQRRRVRQELARRSAALWGDFPLSDDHKLWRQDREFLADYRRLSPGNPYSEDRKYLVRELVRFTRGVEGRLAECGVFEGATAYFIAGAAPDVDLHLFDSFAGLSAAGAEDEVPAWGRSYWSAGAMAAGEETARRVLQAFPNVHFHKGWIPERFPEVADRRFRFVHVDVDLYQPTLDSLEFFYPRLSDRGVVVLDDYGLATCPGAHRAVEEFMADKPEHVLHVPTGQGVIVRRRDDGG
jgi:O-methyltransferase